MKLTYSIYEAKAKLSQVVRTARQNHAVTITERGRPVVKVVAVDDRANLDSRLKDLEDAGIVTRRGATNPANLKPIARVPGALKRFLAERE